MKPEPTATDKMAALYVTERLRGDAIERLNDTLYDAARAVLSHWDRGDLSAAVRLLQEAVDEIDDNHDEVAAIQTGWERKGQAWIRFTHTGETIDPELSQSEVWIVDGMIHALRAEHALTQDDYRNQTITDRRQH